MKIRIKDNSIRLRLSKTDVANLKKQGRVESHTVISPEMVFNYSLQADFTTESFSAQLQGSSISVHIPLAQAQRLTDSDEITIKGWQENGTADKLFILVEKDLQCLDPTHEDQSDMYPNPNSSC